MCLTHIRNCGRIQNMQTTQSPKAGERTQHTPGPWEFRYYGDGCTIVSKHNAPGRNIRDALKGVSVSVNAIIADDQSNAHEASADARLIVAAPELLEAMKSVIYDLQYGTAGRWRGDGSKSIREMIAKVEGL